MLGLASPTLTVSEAPVMPPSVKFAAVVNAYDNHPMLSTWTMLLAVVMLVILAITAVTDEH